MNWKERYTGFRTLTNAKVKPGMLAKLIVGDDKSWCADAWILGLKGVILEVDGITSVSGFNVRLRLPLGAWERHDYDPDENAQEREDDINRGYYLVNGATNWFTFKNK